MDNTNQHYVYFYRTKAGKPLYIGYGLRAVRSAAHLTDRAHNKKLTDALLDGNYTLEIAGPFGDEQRARAVETALISAYQLESTLCNINKGHDAWRFRSLGVPNAFVHRVDSLPLNREEWVKLAKRAGGIVVVNINDCDLEDGRAGDLLANIRSDIEIANRVDRYWQLKGFAIREWVKAPTFSPGLLVGVSGRGALRMVIASIRIDRSGWGDAVAEARRHGLLRIPHDAENLGELDYLKLRGRRIDPAAGQRFGRLRHELFIILDKNGEVILGGKK
ncbi:hypothetical protein ACQ4WY_25675 [Janthinobacterium sp. LB2P49]|uniref:hypothetical protein n=1 Tax=Janthinobacterium sp. LB2P49 TaxID=3424198 RepID=UPI003F24D46B